MQLIRRLALGACAGFAVTAVPALAQAAPEPTEVISPLKAEPDVNGVNLLDGRKIVEMPVVLSIPAAPRLTFDRIQNAAPYVDGTIAHNPPGSYMSSSWSVHYGGAASESFKCEFDDICTSVTDTGSMFRLAGRSYQQAGTGVVYAFALRHSRAAGSSSTREMRYAVATNYPDGESITYTYQAGVLPGDFLPTCVNAPLNANCRTFYRPTRIDSNTGYYITIDYQYTGTDVSQPGWGTPAQAAIYSPSNVLIRRLVYSGAGGNTITDYGNSTTNVGGRTFTTSISNQMGANLATNNATVQLPAEGSAQLTITGSSTHGTNTVDPMIDVITRDGVQWTYTYANARRETVAPGQTVLRYDSVTVGGPNGYSVTYAMDASFTGIRERNRIQSRTDALNRTTSFAYGSGDRLTGITMPEGNSISIGYDVCGNISSKTSTPKAGSALSPINESAAYPPSGPPEDVCPNVLSYRPTSYTDGRANTTNYTHNSLGQLTQELAPADANGVRRQTDITYANSASGISRRDVVRVCGGTSCTGNAESRTAYTYLGNTNLPLTVTQTDEATGATRVTTYA